jgi:hypothetical protein
MDCRAGFAGSQGRGGLGHLELNFFAVLFYKKATAYFLAANAPAQP